MLLKDVGLCNSVLQSACWLHICLLVQEICREITQQTLIFLKMVNYGNQMYIKYFKSNYYLICCLIHSIEL